MKALTQIMVQIVATLLLSPTSTLAGPGYVDLEVCSQLLSHRQGGLLDNLLGEQSLFLPVRSLRRSLHIDHGPYLYQKEKYSLEEILEQEQQRKIMIIESLNELQKMSQLTPVQKMAFYSAIEKIQIVEFHWATLNREKLAKLTLRDIQLRSPKLIYDQIIDSLRQYFARIRSLLAELEVALIVPDLTHVQKLIFEILPPEILNKFKSVQPDSISWQREYSLLLNYEIDSVYNNGRTWVEVKSSLRTDTYDKKAILNRAQYIASTLQILNSVGYQIEKEYVFVGASPSKYLRNELKKLGFKVYRIP